MSSSFGRLKNLGPEKWTKITNDLVRGKPCMAVARMIQQEWQELQDVAEKTLTQQLSRLRIGMVKGAFGEEAAEILSEMDPKKWDIRVLKIGTTLDVLRSLQATARVQEYRINMLWKKEMDNQKPQPGLREALNDYTELVLKIQKVRFDLGMDEFCGIIPGVRGTKDSADLPNGTHIERQVTEAWGVAEEIFRRRGINDVQ